MADVFLSYAHEDQPFARRMAPALEAEGFSVWWDHTIPPGQSWDTFIARNIEEARCCIVLWSGRSVGSDWVKEEATLAKDAGKLIPVQIDAEVPPVGFRRIQAAQLLDWDGNTQNQQWRMLVGEVRRIVSASRAGSAPPPRPVQDYTPTPAPTEPNKGPPWAVLGLIGAVVAAGVIAFVMLNQHPRNEASADVADESSMIATTEPPADAAAPPTDQSAEIERLRRERDAALAAERVASERAASERIQRETAVQQAPRAAAMQGVWTMRRRFTRGTDDPAWTSWTSINTTTHFDSDGAMREYTNSDGSQVGVDGWWRQNGASVSFGWPTGAQTTYVGTITGDRIVGTFTATQNQFAGEYEMTRQR